VNGGANSPIAAPRSPCITTPGKQARRQNTSQDSPARANAINNRGELGGFAGNGVRDPGVRVANPNGRPVIGSDGRRGVSPISGRVVVHSDIGRKRPLVNHFVGSSSSVRQCSQFCSCPPLPMPTKFNRPQPDACISLKSKHQKIGVFDEQSESALGTVDRFSICGLFPDTYR